MFFLVVLTIGFGSIDHVLNIPAINSHLGSSFNNVSCLYRCYVCVYVQVNTYHIYFILSCLFSLVFSSTSAFKNAFEMFLSRLGKRAKTIDVRKTRERTFFRPCARRSSDIRISTVKPNTHFLLSFFFETWISKQRLRLSRKRKSSFLFFYKYVFQLSIIVIALTELYASTWESKY